MVMTADYSQGGGKSQLIEGRRKTWRRNFNGTSLNPDVWNLVQQGASQTIPVAAGALTVNMNTVANAETIIQSVEGFTIPFRVQWMHSMSQRIADNHVYLEVVNAAGDTYQGWYFDGTVTTTAKSVHMNGGNSNPASPSGTFTISATSSTPQIREIDIRIDAVDYIDRPADSTTQGTSRAVRSRTTLDPEEKYYIRMRFKNGAVAPASNTINTVESILVQDINDIPVEIAAGRGQTGANRSLPVSQQGTVVANATLTASSTSTSATVFRNGGLLNVFGTVKATAGRVYGFAVSNPGGTAAYFNIYNTASPTVGTTTPTFQILVPPNETKILSQEIGMTFGTAITVAATDTSVPLSAVAPGTALIVNVNYA